MNLYAFDPGLLAMGASPYLVAKNEWLYHPRGQNSYDTSHVALDVLTEKVLAAPPGQRVLLDIEAFDPATEPERCARNIAAAAWTWKQLDPTAKIGVYRIVPDLHYDAAVKMTKLLIDRKANASQIDDKMQATAAWQRQNDRVATAIVPAVDYLCPCLYAIQDWPYWKSFAHAQLVEAARLAGGKPVLPIIWPVFRNLEPIPLAQWRTMTEWLATHYAVSGILAYSTPKYEGADGWRDAIMAVTKPAPPPPASADVID